MLLSEGAKGVLLGTKPWNPKRKKGKNNVETSSIKENEEVPTNIIEEDKKDVNEDIKTSEYHQPVPLRASDCHTPAPDTSAASTHV